MKPLFIAHRGASAQAPENTVDAVQLAWEQNADAVEVDVQLSADGRIVVFHDFDTLRLTGQSGLVKESTWEELQQLTVTVSGSQARIPLLAQLLPTIPKNKKLIVEIKCGPEIIHPLSQLFTLFPQESKQVEFISFHKPSAEAVKQTFPNNKALVLFDAPSSASSAYRYPGTAEALAYINTHQLDGADLEHGSYIDSDLVDALLKEGKTLYIWTVDDVQEAKRLTQLGVGGITSNRASWLMQRV